MQYAICNTQYAIRNMQYAYAMCNSEEESGTRGGGGGNKAMDFSRRRVLACIACASDRCNATDTL